jgi:Ras-related protein Rab-1A
MKVDKDEIVPKKKKPKIIIEDPKKQDKEVKKQISKENTINIAMLGDSGVGKTSLILRYTDGTDPKDYINIENNIKTKTLNINNKDIQLQIYDNAGQKSYSEIEYPKLRGIHACIIAFDITDRASFNHVESHLGLIQRHGPACDEVNIILVGCKKDLAAKRAVESKEAVAFVENSDRIEAYIETSSVSNIWVEQVFKQATGLVMERLHPKTTDDILKDSLRTELTKYIDRIKEHKIGGKPNFTYGLRWFICCQAGNRKKNYKLAKAILTDLNDPSKSQQSVCSIVADNIKKDGNRWIRSDELSAAIKHATQTPAR